MKQYKQNIILCSSKPVTQTTNLSYLSVPRRSSQNVDKTERPIMKLEKKEEIQLKNQVKEQRSQSLNKANQIMAKSFRNTQVIEKTGSQTSQQLNFGSTQQYQVQKYINDQQKNKQYKSKERPQAKHLKTQIDTDKFNSSKVNDIVRLYLKAVEVLTINGQIINSKQNQQQNQRRILHYSDYEQLFMKVLSQAKNLNGQSKSEIEQQIIEILDLIKKSDQIAFLQRDKTINSMLQAFDKNLYNLNIQEKIV